MINILQIWPKHKDNKHLIMVKQISQPDVSFQHLQDVFQCEWKWTVGHLCCRWWWWQYDGGEAEPRHILSGVINTHYPTAKAGNAFIACGVLYFTEDKDVRVTCAFDLKNESLQDASFDLRPAGGIMAMVSYPNRQLLYMWDNSCVKSCKVKVYVFQNQIWLCNDCWCFHSKIHSCLNKPILLTWLQYFVFRFWVEKWWFLEKHVRTYWLKSAHPHCPKPGRNVLMQNY